MTGGQTVAVGATGPEEGFDCDQNTFKITGGTLVGIGGASSLPTASVTTQPVVTLGQGAANSIVHIQSSDGAEALTFLVPRAYTTMLFSSPKLKLAQTYKVYTGGSVATATGFNGLYTSGTYTPGTSSSTFTTSTVVTKAGGNTGR